MKFKKLSILTLVALALSSCTLFPSTSESDTTSENTTLEQTTEDTTLPTLPSTTDGKTSDDSSSQESSSEESTQIDSTGDESSSSEETTNESSSNESSSSEETTSESSSNEKSSSEESSSEDSSSHESSSINKENEFDIVENLDTKLYLGDLSNPYDFPTVLFDGFEDIPYVSYEYALSMLGYTAVKHTDGYIYSFNYNKLGEVIIDASLDTIYFTNYEGLTSYSYDDKLGNLLAGTIDSLAFYLDSTLSSKVGEGSKLFDLSAYNINIVAQGSEVYIPVDIFSEIIFNQWYGLGIAFNGDDFYLIYADSLISSNAPTSYGEAFYGGSNSTKTKKSTTEAEHFYNMLCFKFDYFYGLKNEKGFNKFSDIVSSMGLESLVKSKNQGDAEKAVVKLIRSYIDDGHSSFGYIGSFGGYSSERQSAVYNSCYYGDRVANLYNEVALNQNLRSSAGLSGDSYTIQDDMLVIRFDGFNSGVYNLYTLKEYGDEYVKETSYSGTFGLFYDAFQASKLNGNIKKVVFDLTCNGGGALYTLIQLLGFFCETANFSWYNTTANVFHNFYFHVDTNLDKNLTNDGYVGDYDFYVLTSNFSFSCGNAFPTFAKITNSAKIIGATSGGGACVVYPTNLPDGTSFNISGNSRISYYNDENILISNDDGIVPDIEIGKSDWYNYAKLRTYLD